jgi:signal transduction histidine kinase
MQSAWTSYAVFILASFIFLVSIAAVLFRGGLKTVAGRMLFFQIGLGLAIGIAVFWAGIQPERFHPDWVRYLPFGSVILLLPSFILFSRSAMQTQRSAWSLPILWLVWVSAILLFSPGLFAFSQVWLERITPALRPALPVAFLFAGWLMMIAQTLADIIQTNRKPTSMLARKRAQLWLLVWLCNSLGSGLLLVGYSAWAILFISLACAGAAAILLTPNLPYPRFLVRSVFSFVFVLVPLVALAWLGYLLTRWVDGLLPGFGPLLVGGALTILWVSTFRLLQRLAPKLTDRLLPATRYDTNRLLREYTHNVSDASAPALLAEASTNLINQAIEVEFVHLYEIISEASTTQTQYHIQDVGGLGDVQTPTLNLGPDSAFTLYFRQTHHPLTVDEVQSAPSFRAADPEELAWFTNPRIELFVPINTKDEWVGLFALGCKSSGAPYTDDDLTLVEALADQLSLGLQNARLVDSLLRVNNDFRRAYSAMDQSNRQLQQAFSQLEKIDKTKSDFISVASHELRTPLTVMRGYNEMLLEDPNIKSNAYHMKMVKGIHTGIMRMTEIIDSMLDVASIDSSTLQLHKETVSIHYIIRSVTSIFQEALDERKLTLKVDNLHDLPSILADGEGLNKVFTHIISNAIKYTPDGGSISIAAQVLAPGQHGFADGGIEVIVSDTGIGIDRDHLTMIFKKFYQSGQLSLHSSGKTKFKGSGPGLGLAIAKGIVEAHMGKIWAESTGMDEETCPGSQIHVALPLQAADLQAADLKGADQQAAEGLG